MRIVVVEDERTLAGFVEQALRAEGCAPTVVHTGTRGAADWRRLASLMIVSGASHEGGRAAGAAPKDGRAVDIHDQPPTAS
jgi:hypothetical protein